MLGPSSRQTPSRASVAERRNAVTVDRMIDSYVAWREACVQLRSAHERWLAAHMTDRDAQRCSHAAYAAALEQEEQAALVYQGWVERVGASARTVAALCPDGSFERSA
jgi:hypothetical protein